MIVSGRICPAVRQYSLRNGNQPEKWPEMEQKQKRAAVAGGSKLITGRRQTEWTGATQCPKSWTDMSNEGESLTLS
jgi:hypothetical protein